MINGNNKKYLTYEQHMEFVEAAERLSGRIADIRHGVFGLFDGELSEFVGEQRIKAFTECLLREMGATIKSGLEKPYIELDYSSQSETTYIHLIFEEWDAIDEACSSYKKEYLIGWVFDYIDNTLHNTAAAQEIDGIVNEWLNAVGNKDKEHAMFDHYLIFER